MSGIDQLWYLIWYPGIGDPSIPGRMTVVLYLGVAALCLICGFRGSSSDNRRKWFWLFLAGMLFLLGIVKQFNLLSGLTNAFSHLAWEGDWYTSRQTIQLVFILVVGLLLFMLLAMVLLKKEWRIYGLPILAFGFLLFFVIARAASFHYIDLLINWRLAGIRVNWILEYGSLGLIGIAAFLALRRQKARKSADTKINQTAGM